MANWKLSKCPPLIWTSNIGSTRGDRLSEAALTAPAVPKLNSRFGRSWPCLVLCYLLQRLRYVRNDELSLAIRARRRPLDL